MRESGGPDHRPSTPPRDRYAAVVAALLEVRIDHPAERFDAELDAALADGRVDASTARTLRWWQRMSVRAAESYASTVVPAVLTARDEADALATSDVEAAGASWRQAVGIETRVGLPHQTQPAHLVAVPAIPAVASTPAAASTPAVAADVGAVPVVPAVPADPAVASDADQTRRAIRAAFRRFGNDIASPSQPVNLIATTVTSAATVTAQRKDRRSHADPATSA